MDSKTLQPEMGSKFVVNAETNRDLQHASELEEAGQTSTFSEEKARADDAESGSVVVPAEQKDENDDGPKGIRFALLFTCILLGSFFIGYDTSCIATLTPVITDQFHALGDLGWYQISYLLAQSATMLIYGQLYSFYSMKTLYMASLFVFVIGSVLSASAATSPAFIVGRALSGLGAAGILAGMNIIVAHTTSLKHRPIYSAIIGGVECIALALGPFISGSIAHYTTWRLSFYIIVPISVSIIVIIFFSIGHIRRHENAHLSSKEGLKRIDWPGFAINVPMTLCLVLGLQWAGTVYAWTNWRIILLLAIAATLLTIFLIVEHRTGDESMVPLRTLRRRSVAFASLITFCNFAHLAVIAYYCVVQAHLDQVSCTCPWAVALAVAALVSGPLTSYIGYYNPTLILGSVLMTVGCGLITTLRPDTSAGMWISYQIIYGIGIGLAFLPPYIAVQIVLPESMVPTALVMLSFTQQFGGIVILSIVQNVFRNGLRQNLTTQVPGIDSDTLLGSGALDLINSVPPNLRDQVLVAYNGALVHVFYVALGLTGMVVVSTLGIEWKSVKMGKTI
ncbi:putative efflux pump antibiotic resistance protein [Hyaloscypha variabilis F]|uniref:Putative efflux pump antibiotic resistance protein n=1 Tax=Hyaloscypha variabilis (strain UAMH 11265 / GT02V1 / F) TaxID=1149755 RepID=A0A2J6S4I2_HYAVF|nr:putative efflux pump antibiotic resistance protein [Hyaloscypha variabilis F]